tara:strand:- start:1796 stop:2164 length:369 start_codon:yes stop_codon:yes gene_type:complete
MKQLGRPDDKDKYISSVLNTLNSSLGADESGNMDTHLKSALTKLNARELITLNTYIAKQNRVPVEQAVSLLPTTTPAQKIRVDEAIKLYKELEIKNASHSKEANDRTNTQDTTESKEFAVRK